MDSKCKVLVDVSKYRTYAECYTEERPSISVGGETFEDWDDLEEFEEEQEEDMQLLSMLLVIEELVGHVDVLAEAEKNFDSNWRAHSHDQTTSAIRAHVEVLLTAHGA